MRAQFLLKYLQPKSIEQLEDNLISVNANNKNAFYFASAELALYRDDYELACAASQQVEDTFEHCQQVLFIKYYAAAQLALAEYNEQEAFSQIIQAIAIKPDSIAACLIAVRAAYTLEKDSATLQIYYDQFLELVKTIVRPKLNDQIKLVQRLLGIKPLIAKAIYNQYEKLFDLTAVLLSTMVKISHDVDGLKNEATVIAYKQQFLDDRYMLAPSIPQVFAEREKSALTRDQSDRPARKRCRLSAKTKPLVSHDPAEKVLSSQSNDQRPGKFSC